MRLFVADSIPGLPIIELLTQDIGLYQTPIQGNLLQTVESLSQSEAILVPHDAYNFSKYSEYIQYLNQLSINRPIIFSDRGDFPKKPKIKNGLALRVALNPGESFKRKLVVPYNVLSLQDLPVRPYGVRPQISFVGYVPRVSAGRIIKNLQQSPHHPLTGNGALVRRITLRNLKASELDINIVSRDTYGANKKTDGNLVNTRNEYIRSMAESDFILAPRGDANQSARLYETLSAGRIPILPNTNQVLPNPFSQSRFDLGLPLCFSPLSRKSFENILLAYWGGIETNDKYTKTQLMIKDYFRDNLEFNGFMRRFFSSSRDSLEELFNS
jgi:hypothetical protein